jgi:Zn-dependent peptidase ImmA (M78 family)
MKKIEKLAHRITSRFGNNSPFLLCDCMGVQVQRLDLPKQVRGFCFRTDAGAPVIVLKEDLSKTESGYCCAHELGHLLLHPGLNAQVIADLTNLCAPRYEREADFFAACLLIDPNYDEWSLTYDPLTQDQIARLSGLPRRVVGLRFEK